MAPRRTKVTLTIPPAGQASLPPPKPPALPGRGEATQTLVPVAITGADFDVDLTNGGRMRQPALAKVGNVSPYLMELTWIGHRDHLRPMETNVLPVLGSSSLHVHPIALTTPTPTSAASQLVVAVATEGLTFPGTYPVINSNLGALGYGFGAVLALVGVLGTRTGSFTIPPGTQSLSIVTMTPAGQTSQMSLTGANSSFPYYSQVLGSGGAYELIGVDYATDTTINYSTAGTSGAGSPISWYITALPTPPPTFIARTAAPWQVPTTPAPLNQNIGASSFFTWITPPAGRALRLFSGFLHWKTSTRGFGAIKGDGTTGGLQNYDQQATNFLDMNYGGLRLAVNEKLLISNDDTGTGQNINGGLMYSLD